jgi:alanyl-tRNA synthetase
VLQDENIRQNGSDITAERTRFDFSFPRKLTQEEIKKIEDAVNEVIAKNMEVVRDEMPYADAVKSGALHFFREKYPERVSVYAVRDSKTGEVFSKELCGGPHVSRTGEIGRFKIIKEESSSAGVRRIRATLLDK